MIAENLQTLDPEQLRQAVQGLLAELGARSAIIERNQREIAFKQATNDQAHARDGRAQAAEVRRQV